MADLVVGDDILLGLRDHPRLALGPGDDARDRFLELDLTDRLLVAARGKNSGLINKVAEVGAGKAGRLAGQHLEVDLPVERFVARMHFEDGAPAPNVRPVERDMPIEPTGTQERGVED